MKHIPQGSFCYHVAPTDDRVMIDPTSPRLGFDLREASWVPEKKIVLCPYWVRTDYGTVRCEYLRLEVLAHGYGPSDGATERLGEAAASKLEHYSDLSDMLKTCKVNPRPDNPFIGLFDKNPQDS